MKKKIVSKVFALLLAACTVLSACGNESGNQSVGQTDKSETNDTVQEGEEPYTIVYAFDVWVQQADWDLVEENLSNIVYDKIGAKVKLLPMTGANYQQEVNLMITSGEKLDLVNASARTTFSSDVTSNKLLGLDEETVRKYAPDAMEVIGDYMEATTVDGKIYGFPTIRDMASAYGLILRNDIIEKYGIDADAGLTVEQLDDLFARIKEGEPDKYVTQPQSQGTSILESLFKTYDGLGDTMGVLMDWGQGDLTVQNLFDTEYYEECVRKAREWNEKGYILPDASTNPDTGVAYFKTGKVASTMSLIHPGVPTDSTNMTGIPCSTAIVNPAFGNTQTVGAVIQSIPVSCKNPEKVLEFVNLLYSDAEVYNALVWGIEGTHYQHVKGSEKWITYPDGVTGETSGYTLSATYAFGNRYLSYIWNTDPEDLNEKYEEFNDNAIKSKALGFVFDTTPVKAEAAAVQAVMDEYRLPLENGVIDPDENLPKFRQALKDAGIDTVIAEKQRQLEKLLPLYIMALPALVYLFINNYLPLTGMVVAFKDFDYSKGIYGSDWAGFRNFLFLFKNSVAFIITRNTILYNVAFIIINTFLGILVAILLSEVTSKKALKVYQTVILLPYLFSIVIISYLVFAFLSTDVGFINKGILEPLGKSTISWYNESKYWPIILPIVNTWKSFGFQATIYYANVISIDKSYYEAAQLDGASKLQQVRYITLVLLKPVIIMMILLAVGKIFYSDFGLFYQVTQNSGAIYSTTNTIDTYVYRTLIQTGDVGMSAAAGVYQSVVGFLIVLITNLLLRKISPEDSLF